MTRTTIEPLGGKFCACNVINTVPLVAMLRSEEVKTPACGSAGAEAPLTLRMLTTGAFVAGQRTGVAPGVTATVFGFKTKFGDMEFASVLTTPALTAPFPWMLFAIILIAPAPDSLSGTPPASVPFALAVT